MLALFFGCAGSLAPALPGHMTTWRPCHAAAPSLAMRKRSYHSIVWGQGPRQYKPVLPVSTSQISFWAHFAGVFNGNPQKQSDGHWDKVSSLLLVFRNVISLPKTFVGQVQPGCSQRRCKGSENSSHSICGEKRSLFHQLSRYRVAKQVCCEPTKI